MPIANHMQGTMLFKHTFGVIKHLQGNVVGDGVLLMKGRVTQHHIYFPQAGFFFKIVQAVSNQKLALLKFFRHVFFPPA